MNPYDYTRRAQVFGFLAFVLLLLYSLVTRSEAQDTPTAEPTLIPITVTVTASEAPADGGSEGDEIPPLLQPIATFVYGFLGGAFTGVILVFGVISRVKGDPLALSLAEKLYNSAPVNVQEKTKGAANVLRDTVDVLNEASDGIPASEKGGGDAQVIPRAPGAVTAKVPTAVRYFITPPEEGGL